MEGEMMKLVGFDRFSILQRLFMNMYFRKNLQNTFFFLNEVSFRSSSNC